MNVQSSQIITRGINDTGLLSTIYDWWYEKVRPGALKHLVLDSLVRESNILILYAHGDNQTLYLPNGDRITTDDLQQLDLTRSHPLVLLLSCEGARFPLGQTSLQGWPEELKRAGAGAVWGFTSPIDSREALAAAKGFVQDIKSGHTLLDALETMSRGLNRQGTGTRLKVLYYPFRSLLHNSQTQPVVRAVLSS